MVADLPVTVLIGCVLALAVAFYALGWWLRGKADQQEYVATLLSYEGPERLRGFETNGRRRSFAGLMTRKASLFRHRH